MSVSIDPEAGLSGASRNGLSAYERSSRPAFFWTAEEGLLWANPAAAHFSKTGSVESLLTAGLGNASFGAQMEKIARTLPPQRSRLELLRLPVGGRSLSFVGRISPVRIKDKEGLLIVGPDTNFTPAGPASATENALPAEDGVREEKTEAAASVKKEKPVRSPLSEKAETAISKRPKAQNADKAAKGKAVGRLEPHEQESLQTIAKMLKRKIAAPKGKAKKSKREPEKDKPAKSDKVKQAQNRQKATGPQAPLPSADPAQAEPPAPLAQDKNTSPKKPQGDLSARLAALEEERARLQGEIAELTRARDEDSYVLEETEAQNQNLQSDLHHARILAAELQTILDTATDGIFILDSEGHILNMNKPAESLFGAELTSLEGENLIDLLTPESQGTAVSYLHSLKHAFSLPVKKGCEVTGLSRKGQRIPIYMTIGTLGADTPDSLFCAVLRDITQWKLAESELTEAKKRAEEASNLKSDFLAKISHEIRTPLNAIIGFSEVMLEERFGPIGSERYKQYVNDIHTSGGYLLSLVNDLLDLSKIESGKLDLTFAPVYLNDLVLQVLALLQTQANRNGVILRSSLQAVPPVIADSRSLRQIMINLLSNAVRFTPAGGQIIVSTNLEADNAVLLRVKDTGIGMREDEIALALEPFRQIRSDQHKPERDGTGLGLPISKALAEANHAGFHIDSRPGKGTIVSVAFPPGRVLEEQL